MAKAAEVRFYFDADILGLAHIIAALRADCTYPGDPGAEINRRTRPPCTIKPDTPDPMWVPEVTRSGWIIISRDYHIRENPVERRIVRECGARMVALSGRDAPTKWGQLELLMMRWRKIEALSAEPGPFIYRASLSAFRALDLDDDGARPVRPSPRPHGGPTTGVDAGIGDGSEKLF